MYNFEGDAHILFHRRIWTNADSNKEELHLVTTGYLACTAERGIHCAYKMPKTS